MNKYKETKFSDCIGIKLTSDEYNVGYITAEVSAYSQKNIYIELLDKILKLEDRINELETDNIILKNNLFLLNKEANI